MIKAEIPLGYLISTLWGGQEGTFLLWIFFTSLLGIIMIRTGRSFENGNMVFVHLFLLSIIIILIKKSPFELLPVFRTEGAGLNPLLQNFWMQIHPPIMFVGFSGAVFPFAFAMTGLIEKRYSEWAESARKWTVFAWLSLGVSLVMGGYWAYITLAGGLMFFVIVGLSLIGFRWKEIKPNPAFSKVASRSYMLTLGVILLFVGGVLTLIGTSAPLLTRFNDNPSAVGLHYYFVTMTPIAIGVMLLLGLFPAFKWNNGLSKPKLLMSGGIAGVIGIAIAMIGAGVSAGFETKQTIVLPQNKVVQAMGYDLKFTKMVDNPKGFNCHVEVLSEGSDFTAILPHEFPKNQDGVMRKPFVNK